MDWFANVNIAWDFHKLYSTGSSFAARKFVWAAKMGLTIAVPAATAVGSIYLGHIPVNSLLNSGNVTVQQLINVASKVEQGMSFSLCGSLSNTTLGSNVAASIMKTSELDPAYYKYPNSQVGSELIAYAVLVRPAQSITATSGATTNMPFSLVGSISGNFGFYPTATDALMYNLFKINPYSFGDSLLTDVPYRPLTIVTPLPYNRQTLSNFIGALPLTTIDVGGISTTSSALATMNPPDSSFDSEDDIPSGPRWCHFSCATRAQLLYEFVEALDISVEDLQNLSAFLAKRPLKLPIAPLLLGGLKLVAENLPSMISYARKNKIGMGTVAKIVGKNTASYIYGEPSDAPKVKALTDLTRPVVRKRMMDQLASAAPAPAQPPPKQSKRSRKKKKKMGAAISKLDQLD